MVGPSTSCPPGRLPALTIILGALGLACLLHVVSFWGVPMDSDTKPTYLMQVDRTPGLREVVPYGLWVAMAAPMGPVEACLEAYAAYRRYNCVETTLMRGIAALAGDNPDLWRIVYFAFNGLCVTLFVLIARDLRLPTVLLVLFALSLISGPLDLWTDAKSAEPKATALWLLALHLALRSRTWRGQALSAVAMLLAALTKEPFAAAWVAVLGAALYRHLQDTGQPVLLGLRSAWRLLLPHGLAMLAVAAYVAGLMLTVVPRTDIALPTDVPYPPPGLAARQYLWVIQPVLLRGHLLVIVLAGAAVLLVLALRGLAPLRSKMQQTATAPYLVLLGGLVAAIVLHGLVYYAARRAVSDERYLVPANYLTCLALGLALLPLLDAMAPPARRALGVAVALAAAGSALWALGFSRGLYGGMSNEMSVITLGVAMAAAGAAVLVAGLGRWRKGAGLCPPWRLGRPWVAGVAAATTVLLFSPHVDAALGYAGQWRVYEDGWQVYLDDVLAQAPPNGHVLLRFAGPNMIEHAWATEVYTLRRGRPDLTYHLDVGSPPYPEGPTDEVHEYFVSAYNQGRAPLPAGGAGVLVAQSSRTGTQRDVPSRLSGRRALALLAESPAAFLRNRYLEGRYSYWRYELSGGD